MHRYGEEDIFDRDTVDDWSTGRTIKRVRYWFETEHGELNIDDEVIVCGRRCIVREISQGAGNGIDAVCAIEGPDVEEKLDEAVRSE